MSDTKPSNPKDIVGSKKLDLGLVPDSAMVALAQAFLEGALKYGRYNWRIAGVSASTYHAALKRHIAKWWNGQDEDPDTRVQHLANAMACIAIIFDAELYGMLTDDRPPCPDPDAMARAIDKAASTIEHLKKTFAAHTPKQYTIGDTRHADPATGEFLAGPLTPLPEGIKHCVEAGCTKPAVQGLVRCGPHSADFDYGPDPDCVITPSGPPDYPGRPTPAQQYCRKLECLTVIDKPHEYCNAHRPISI